MAGVDPEWSHSMAHALALDTRTWPRGDVPGLGLTDVRMAGVDPLLSQLRRHGAHGWCGPGVVTQHGTCAGTGHTDVAKRGRSWPGVDRRGRRCLKGVSIVTSRPRA